MFASCLGTISYWQFPFICFSSKPLELSWMIALRISPPRTNSTVVLLLIRAAFLTIEQSEKGSKPLLLHDIGQDFVGS